MQIVAQNYADFKLLTQGFGGSTTFLTDFPNAVATTSSLSFV